MRHVELIGLYKSNIVDVDILLKVFEITYVGVIDLQENIEKIKLLQNI